MQRQPTISIITVVYNSAPLLELTIQSVIAQTYPHIEYVIVDGASTDGSLSIIKKYESQISRWISEPDKGLYDAMNKGIDLATGDYIWFMNAGDTIHSKDTVAKIVATVQPDTDIFYGEVMMVDDNRQPHGTRSACTTQQLPDRLTWKSLRFGMVVCHQGFIPKRGSAPKYMMNNLSADIDWVIQCLQHSRNTTNTKLILTDYLMGGLSKNRHRQSLKDRYRILKIHYGWLPNLLAYLWIIVRAGWYKLVKRRKYV